MGTLAFLGAVAWGAVVAGALLFALSQLNINIRTRIHAFRKYPAVRQTANLLRDASKNETIRDYIPALHIDGNTFFQIVYVKKGDPLKTPTGILILNDQGHAVVQYGVLENAKLTASICIACGHVLQQRAKHVRRSMRNVLEKQIPEAVRILKDQEKQFSIHGFSSRWTSIMESAAILPQALRESITILDGEEAFRKALGYAFALDFHYEDALRLRELYLAYVKYLNAAYRRKLIAMTTEAAMLIQILEGKTDWQEKDAAMAALSTLAVAGTEGFLARICQKEFEGVVNDGDRKAYEEKTRQAKKIGVPVVAG